MTMVALIADAHVANHRRWGGAMSGGLNDRARVTVMVLEQAARAAAMYGCRALFVLGDLFDSSRPSPPLVFNAFRALRSAGLPVYVLLGNHDRQSQHDEDHACAPAVLFPGVTIITQPTIIHVDDPARRTGSMNLLCVPYQAGRADEWIPEAVKQLLQSPPPAADKSVVLTHAGIWDDTTAGYLRSAHDAIGLGHVRWLLEAHNLHAMYAGNWHTPKHWAWSRERPFDIGIPGTVCPHNFTDAALPGGMTLVDTAVNTAMHHVLRTPMFASIDAKEIGSYLPRAIEHPTYFRVRARSVDELQDPAVRRVIDHLASGGNVVDTIIDDEDVARAAASRAVRAASDVDALFTEMLQVEKPGTAEGAFARLQRYRAEASP